MTVSRLHRESWKLAVQILVFATALTALIAIALPQMWLVSPVWRGPFHQVVFEDDSHNSRLCGETRWLGGHRIWDYAWVAPGRAKHLDVQVESRPSWSRAGTNSIIVEEGYGFPFVCCYARVKGHWGSGRIVASHTYGSLGDAAESIDLTKGLGLTPFYPIWRGWLGNIAFWFIVLWAGCFVGTRLLAKNCKYQPRCTLCGYPLEGLPQIVTLCPECGQPLKTSLNG